MFTGLVIDALDGAAADLMGQVTPGGIYAHIDQSLGTWSQRPVFRTNIKRFVTLRQTEPPISLTDLRRIAELFPGPAFQFYLKPSYEPEHKDANPEHTIIFAVLQKYNRVYLLVQVDAPHIYFAAIESKVITHPTPAITTTGRFADSTNRMVS